MTPVEVGFIGGVTWAAVLLVWTLAELTLGEPSPWLLLVPMVYDGFDFSPKGIMIGAFWAFADGFVSGFLLWSLVCWLF